NQLTGTIPSELGQLANFKYLSLSRNQLTGTIPNELGQSIQLLYLNDNQFTGTIPSELSQLTKLQTLYLNNNQFTGTIPSELGQLGELQKLYLSNNQISGTIPSALSQLASLRELLLNDNQLTGTIPSELAQLANLTKLYLSDNQLIDTIPIELGQLASLRELLLNDNQLTGTIPSELGQLSELRKLYLGNNQFTGTIPSELSQLANLTNFYLNNNQLTGSIPSELGQLAKLEFLYFQSNQLTGTIPSELSQLTKLRYLSLDNNYLTGDSPTVELADFLQSLRNFKVHNNCLNPTDITIQAILDSKDSSWRNTQTNCPPNEIACQLYVVHDDKLNDSQFFTVNLNDLSTTELGNLHAGYDIESLAIHPQTNKLYAAAGDDATTGEAGYLYEVNPDTGELTTIGDTQFAEIEDLAFSPDGTLYAWAKGQGLITIDVVSGQGTLVLASTVALEGLTLSKQADTTIFYGGANGELWQYDLESDKLEVVCTDLQGEIEALEMMSSGDLLIGSHKTAFGMHLLNPDTCELVIANDSLTHQFNDVEGLAIPIEACQ
ncbi:leucine-rich repeat domain-containing protein, partial [Candidatus Albibeggiatoa sp. nov. NOAA]|uniref:leucine-rich repeat domain-containing protein n=1 Tax=Candidatus Albibeggiatoa sp. nov. NOAA TaxID=3162724 RepID=UPI0032F13A4A|nr:leucine-rich repeat domain-containing protein [Thiotrichaceae bacterium]